MPDIYGMKKELEPTARFLELMPMVEEMLVNGTPRQRRELSEYLAEQAADFRVDAYTAAGGGGDGLPHSDPKLWKELEASQDHHESLNYVLLLWNQAILYQHWSEAICRPKQVLLRFGLTDAELRRLSGGRKEVD